MRGDRPSRRASGVVHGVRQPSSQEVGVAPTVLVQPGLTGPGSSRPFGSGRQNANPAKGLGSAGPTRSKLTGAGVLPYGGRVTPDLFRHLAVRCGDLPVRRVSVEGDLMLTMSGPSDEVIQMLTSHQIQLRGLIHGAFRNGPTQCEIFQY